MSHLFHAESTSEAEGSKDQVNHTRDDLKMTFLGGRGSTSFRVVPLYLPAIVSLLVALSKVANRLSTQTT